MRLEYIASTRAFRPKKKRQIGGKPNYPDWVGFPARVKEGRLNSPEWIDLLHSIWF
jgi:hypothetical protein